MICTFCVRKRSQNPLQNSFKELNEQDMMLHDTLYRIAYISFQLSYGVFRCKKVRRFVNVGNRCRERLAHLFLSIVNVNGQCEGSRWQNLIVDIKCWMGCQFTTCDTSNKIFYSFFFIKVLTKYSPTFANDFQWIQITCEKTFNWVVPFTGTKNKFSKVICEQRPPGFTDHVLIFHSVLFVDRFDCRII